MASNILFHSLTISSLQNSEHVARKFNKYVEYMN